MHGALRRVLAVVAASGNINTSVFARTASISSALPGRLSNACCSAFRSSRTTLLSSASTFRRMSEHREDRYCERVHHCDLLKGRSIDLHRQRELHSLQDHGLRRGAPVDCFYEGENMLVIHPDECIDCGVCEPECPVDAIKPDTELGA